MINPGSGLTQTGTIKHDRIISAPAGADLDFSVVYIGGREHLLEGWVYYRTAGQTAYQEGDLLIEDYRAMGSFSAEEVAEPGMEYFFELKMDDNSSIRYPEGAPEYAAPFYIEILPQKKTRSSTDGLIILSPERGHLVESDEVVIAISISQNLYQCDLRNLRLKFDGSDITPLTEFSENLISVVIEYLQPGTHTITLETIENGTPEVLLTWGFTKTGLVAKKSQEFTINGDLLAGASHENLKSAERDVSYLDARINGSKGNLKWLARAYITSQERGNQQPRNRFKASLNYKDFVLNGGDTQPRFSEFSLWGVRTRGAELKTPDRIYSLHASFGQLRRSIDQIAAVDTTVVIDPVSGDTLKSQTNPALDSLMFDDQILRSGTFSRYLMGLKQQLKIKNSFILALNIVKVKDDLESIETGTQPQDNLVLGLNVGINSPDQRFRLWHETAYSMFNKDITEGAMSQAESFEKVIVINQFFQPLPSDSAILDENLSTSQIGTMLLAELHKSARASRTELSLNYFNNMLTLGYKSIGPNFKALGSPMVQTDVRGFTIEDRLRLLKNRLYLTFGYENYHNNVSGTSDRTTHKDIFRGGISYYSAPKYPNISLGMRSYDRSNDAGVSVIHFVTGDSLVVDNRIKQNNSTYNVGLDQSFQCFGFNHLATVFFNRDFGTNKINASSNTELSNLNFNLTSRHKRVVELRLAVNQASQQALDGKYKLTYTSGSVSTRYLMIDDTFWIAGSFSSTITDGGNKEINSAVVGATNPDQILREDVVELVRHQISLGLEYRINQHHELNLRGYYYLNEDNGYAQYYSDRKELRTAAKDSEYIARLQYRYQF